MKPWNLHNNLTFNATALQQEKVVRTSSKRSIFFSKNSSGTERIQQNKLLEDVVLIRPIAIFLVILTHSFALNSGTWPETDWFQSTGSYKWINPFMSSFRMQVIIAVAGYVFAYQKEKRKKIFVTKYFILLKFKRLILPSLFFGIFYVYFLEEFNFLDPIPVILNLLTGPGHLWFLPMIFWVFVIAETSGKIIKNFSPAFVLFGLCLISLFSLILPSYLGIKAALMALVFFYTGYYLQRYSDAFQRRFCNLKYLILLAYLFITLFLLYYYFAEPIAASSNKTFLLNKLFSAYKYLYVLAMRTIGIILFFVSARIFLDIRKKPLPIFFSKLNEAAYGIYVFHQFILIALIYKTNVLQNVNPYLLPFILLFISLIFSWLLTQLTLKTKFGRILIG